MKRFLAVFVGGLGAGAFWRRKRRRDTVAEIGPNPADELRARLAESKAAAEDAPAEQEPIAEVERSPLDPDSRRRDVHDRARAALDDLR